MPTISVQGRQIEVDDSFLLLSPDQQHKAVDDIAKSLGAPARSGKAAPPAGPKMTAGEQFRAGFMDPFYGTEQLTRRPGVDEMVREREAELKQKGMPPGFNLPRAAGSAINPINLMAGGGAMGAGSRILGGVVGGAFGAGTQPATGKDYESEKYEQLIGGAATGGAMGAAGTALAGGGRVLTPFPLSPRRRELVNILREEGVEPTAGQQSGSRGLRYAESHLGELPGAAGAGEAANERVSEQFTRAALRRAGINADRITDRVMDQGFINNSARFNNLASQTNLQGDRQLATDFRDTLREYYEHTPENSRRSYIENTMRDIAAAIRDNNGTLDGRTYQQIRSRLAQYARQTGDNDYRRALEGTREALDNAMERTIQVSNPRLIGEWRDVRNQYRNLLAIEKAATGGGAAAKEELISPAALRRAIEGQDRRAYARGRGDFAQLARAGEAILTPLPQSGTAPRAATTHPIRSLIGGTAGRALHSDPVQNYLKNQLWGGQVPQALPNLGPALAPAAGAAMEQPEDALAPSSDALSR